MAGSSRPSVYEGRYPSTGPLTVVMTRYGRFVGLERDGDFEPASTKPCCSDPGDCQRPECWKPCGGAGGEAAS